MREHWSGFLASICSPAFALLLGFLTLACGGLFAHAYYLSLGVDYLGLVSGRDLFRLPVRFPASIAVAVVTLLLAWFAGRAIPRALVPIVGGLCVVASLALVLLARASADEVAKGPCVTVMIKEGRLDGSCARIAGVLGGFHVFRVDARMVAVPSGDVLALSIPRK